MNNNLDIKGSFQINFVREDGTIRDTVNKTNNLTEYFWEKNDKFTGTFNLSFNDAGLITPKFDQSNIHISIANISKDYEKELYFLHNIYATGAENIPILGNKIQVYYANEINNTGYVEVRERINFTDSLYGAGNGYSRTFNCIGITQGVTSSADNTRVGTTSSYTYPTSSVYAPCFAYTFLTPFCTQLSNEFLDIVYKVQVSGSDYIVVNSYLSCLSGASDFGIYLNRNAYSTVKVSPIENTSYQRYSCSFDTTLNEQLLAINPTTVTDLNQSRQLKHTPTIPNNALRGRIVRSALLGVIRNSDNYFLNGSDIKFSSSRFQPIYSHNIQANTPYYDINTLASGSIKPNLSGNWDKDIPEIYMIIAATTGAMGVSTYKYAKRKILGTTNATSWSGLSIFTPYLHRRTAPVPNLHANYHFKVFSNSEAHCQRIRYSDTQIIQGSTTGILLVDIFNGEYQAWDSTTTPALTANAITQFALQGNDLYVACRNTGLWKIDINDNTVTNISSTSCLGVDASSNKVIALFDDAGVLKLANDIDNFASYLVNFSFPLSNLFESSLSNLFYIKIDQNPSSTSYRIAIASVSASSTYRIYWWNSADGVTVTGPSIFNSSYIQSGLNSIAANPTNLVSTINGAWVLGFSSEMRYCIFGSADISGSSRGNLIGTTPLVVEDGNILYRNGIAIPPLLVGGVNATTVNAVTIPNISTTGITDTTQPSVVYLGKGILLHDNIIRIGPGNAITSSGLDTATSTSGRILSPYLWDTYAWDGDEWVLDNPTWNGTSWVVGTGLGKQTHTTTEALNSDISISFTELATSGLVATNYYTQIVCNGVCLDEITNPFSFTYYWGYYQLKEVSIGSGVTIPNSAPYMIVVPKSNYKDTLTKDNSFCCLFGEDPSKHNINIDGYGTPASIITDQTQSPLANEVLFNQSNGVLIFNSSDANKAINSSSTYTYVAGHKKSINYSVSPFAGVYKPVILLRSDLGVISSAGQVSNWEDQSGYENDASKATGTKPTLGTLNSINTINFATNSSYLELPNIASFSDGWTLVTLIKFNGISSNRVFFSSDLLSNNIDGQFSISNDATGKISYTVYSKADTSGNFYNRVISTNNVLTNNTWALVSITSLREARYTNDNNLIIRVNGITQSTSVTGGDTTVQINHKKYPSDKCILGGSLQTPSNSFIGEMAFFSFYKNYLTIPELQLVESEVTSIFGPL